MDIVIGGKYFISGKRYTLEDITNKKLFVFSRRNTKSECINLWALKKMIARGDIRKA